MIRAMIVTNMKKGFSKREVGKYLQNIQRIAGMHNICISKAIIDHSEGVEPFVSDALDMIENVICTADCNAIILDDTFGYDITDSYAALKELADICNTPIYHYKGGTMRMSDVNNDFDYDSEPFEVLEMQMVQHAEPIYRERVRFIEQFTPYFQEVYRAISGDKEQVSLGYVSQLHERDLAEALARTRGRDLILGWTSQGVHKDELEMKLGDYPLKRVGSQGQQKSYLLAMKLGQALYLSQVHAVKNKPILLLDDIFDKLDSERVARIVQLVVGQEFGQIFITDTDRQHLTTLLSEYSERAKVFEVTNGDIREIN